MNEILFKPVQMDEMEIFGHLPSLELKKDTDAWAELVNTRGKVSKGTVACIERLAFITRNGVVESPTAKELLSEVMKTHGFGLSLTDLLKVQTLFSDKTNSGVSQKIKLGLIEYYIESRSKLKLFNERQVWIAKNSYQIAVLSKVKNVNHVARNRGLYESLIICTDAFAEKKKVTNQYLQEQVRVSTGLIVSKNTVLSAIKTIKEVTGL